MNTKKNNLSVIESLFWEKAHLKILDQTLLPEMETYMSLLSPEDVWSAIRSLRVRGAPAIGIAAAYGLCLEKPGSDVADYKKRLEQTSRYLAGSRPTAVNLEWALNRMMAFINARQDVAPDVLHQAIVAKATEIHIEDKSICKRIGETGLPLIPDQANIITHCNTGSLATGQYGTALSVIYHAHLANKNPTIWVDETRPLFQGSRLTSWELQRAGIRHQIITDSMAGYVMSKNNIDLIITGADRVTRNGDTANKIGTYSLAVLAHYHNIPFYIALPSSTFDPGLDDGSTIPIEERDANEIRQIGSTLTAPPTAPVYNPAFDVTPAGLITAFITEKGIIRPPYKDHLSLLTE